ncbi:hypothetical protein B0H11DRAFT_1009382 [Mycena galericulata]|nr:hypothetical protein B0H11DRAFT_1009382 [Mycena galericulata]
MTRYTPYDMSSRRGDTRNTSNDRALLSSLYPYVLEQSIPALQPFSFPQSTGHPEALSSVTLPPFSPAFPPSGLQFLPCHPPSADETNSGAMHAQNYDAGSIIPPFCFTFPPSFSQTQQTHLVDDLHSTAQSSQSNFIPPPSQDHDYSTGNTDSYNFHQGHHFPEHFHFVQGGTFISAENLNHHGEAGIHILRQAVTLEALHNSAESFPQPRCHPETRTDMLKKLYNWATDVDSVHSIMWLYGPAGAGKSAVMQTLCQQFQDAGRLGGSFFFKRQDKICGHAKKLFVTLAFQLALHSSELRSAISQRVEADPSVLGRGMDVQLRTLILEPCKLLHNATPMVLLIDGLDECEGHNIQQEILHLMCSNHGLPLRIIIASRPEGHIQESFQEFFQGFFDSTNIEKSFDDVRTYLVAEFSRIHGKHHTMRHIRAPWPSRHIVEKLVHKSSGYFIYASTVIKFIDDEYSRPPTQLDIILRNVVPHDTEFPFGALDQLYIQILSGVPAKHHVSLCDILCMVVNFSLSEEEIEQVLDLAQGDVSLIVRPLCAVLDWTRGKSVRVYHASFYDFLKDAQRSSIFCLDGQQYHIKKARAILRLLAWRSEDPVADDDLHWHLTITAPHWIEYTTSLLPPMDFVPLFEQVNLDYIFSWPINDHIFANLLNWLKNIQPIPASLMQRWENYRFMHLYEYQQDQVLYNLLRERNQHFPERTNTQILSPTLTMMCTAEAGMNDEIQTILTACRKHVLQSKCLIRILQAQRLLLPNRGDYLSYIEAGESLPDHSIAHKNDHTPYGELFSIR